MYGNSYTWTSYVVLVVKKLPANAGDTRDSGLIPGSGRAPGGEMATHSSILAWKSHGQSSLVGYSPWGCKVSDTTAHMHTHTDTCT